MLGDFLTAEQMKTTREGAKEEILKYRERDSLGLSGDVLQWSKNKWSFHCFQHWHRATCPFQQQMKKLEVFKTAGDYSTVQFPSS